MLLALLLAGHVQYIHALSWVVQPPSVPESRILGSGSFEERLAPWRELVRANKGSKNFLLNGDNSCEATVGFSRIFPKRTRGGIDTTVQIK